MIMEKKEAMKILKDFYDKSALFSIRTALDTVFPELTESEDEKIRKEIIAIFKGEIPYTSEEDTKRYIAWIEKQSKKKSTDEVLKIRQELYQSGYNDGYKHGQEDMANKEYVFRPVAGTMIENAVEQALKQGNVVLAFNGFYTPVKGKTSDEILREYDNWLKKQGKTFTKKDVDDAYLQGICDAKHEIEKQGDYNRLVEEMKKRKELLSKEKEKATSANDKLSLGGRIAMLQELLALNICNTTDKVEPKFKVGDWVILNGTVAQILDKQKYGFVGLDIDGKDFFCNYGHTDSMRLWTIADAKDGDVLLEEETGEPFIYNGNRAIYFSGYFLGAYCGIYNGKFNPYGNTHHWGENSCPATKEQRDLLFQKMENAGYMWDSEKKELKKIKPKTLNADKVIEWLNNQACLGWIEDVEVDKFVEKFKKDFEI